MGIRMSGLASGLDTESIIKELMTAQRTKQKKVTDKQTKLTWTQEKWKELNSKLYSFYKVELSAMTKQGTFQAKKVSSSNESKATATAGVNAAPGSHELEVLEIASSQSITSGKLARTDPSKGKVLSTTKLSDLGIGVGTEIFINGPDITTSDERGNSKLNKNEVTFEVKEGTTVQDFIKACQSAGLQANFDEGQQRIFINSKESGADQGFEIKMSTNGTMKGLEKALDLDSVANPADKTALLDAINTLGSYTSAQIQTVYDAVIAGDSTALAGEPQDLVDALTLLENRMAEASEDDWDTAAEKAVKDEWESDYFNEKALAAMGKPAGTAVTSLTQQELEQFVEERKQLTDNKDQAVVDADYAAWKTSNAADYTAKFNNRVKENKEKAIDGLKNLASNSAQGKTNELFKLGLNEMSFDADGKIVAAGSTDMTMVAARDAKIKLDGAVLNGSSNQFKVNNLTLDLKSKTEDDEKIMITVKNDTEEAYKQVKNFVTKYNELLKEMNTLYYAESSRGYDPLTDEEKDAMRDEEIERWEDKIKDSLLRRDEILSGLTSSMRYTMQRSVRVNGKSYSMASIGIQTGIDYSEKGLLHIYGDKDDSDYASEDNKLQQMLDEDPDAVMEIVNKLGQTLYDDFANRMTRIEGVRSIYTFYNDKEMEKLQRDYKKQVKDWEKKLNEMENRYYKQFTAMEKAMSQLQNQSNSLSSMLGLGGN